MTMTLGDRPQPDAMFALDGVTRTYGETVALAHMSIRIAHGERVAVLGPSGGGKTTFLHLLGGVIRPDVGTVEIDGKDLDSLEPGRELASLVGFVHQQFDLVPHLPVMHNVMAGKLGQWGLLRSMLSLVSARERNQGLEALARVGIEDKAQERTSNLSGGEQQRVAIARILVQSPRAVLADEPVASLDPARAADLIQLLVEIAAETGRTLVVSLHATEFVRTYFDRAIGLRTGHIEFDIPAGEVDDELLTDLYHLSKTDAHGSRSNGGAGQGGPGGARTADRPPAGSVPPQPRFRTVD